MNELISTLDNIKWIQHPCISTTSFCVFKSVYNNYLYRVHNSNPHQTYYVDVIKEEYSLEVLLKKQVDSSMTVLGKSQILYKLEDAFEVIERLIYSP